ncbi:LLM class flavin-dependent oxidoreductase [Alphaproteobacteria bacterium]|jgi:F420-dependent oxidoreductase-like protein|nr:LLM class flavin-dependent oxidoreductase [Alphaproteobacteria bacterium]|tara:strand:- start:1442 stop:2473 length:1032 start_codon:yes stop_codon:yes gene_type:complete
MKTSVHIGWQSLGDFQSTVDFVQEAERLGVDCAWASEAWWTDAATPLAYLAGQTSKIKLGSHIMQISARTPAMTAMTALTLNGLSNGRFILGLGVSGPQVVEGLHGAPYKGPLTRLKETVDIVRMAFRGERIQYDGKYHQLPLPGGEGKALKLLHEPADIPVMLATLGPKALEYTGASADGWLGTSFSPDHPEALMQHLERGAKSAGRSLSDMELQTACTVVIGEDVEGMIEAQRAKVAFQMGAMGSAKTNFYNEAVQRAGYAEDAQAVQSLWVAGKRDEARKRVPDAMITKFGAIGTPEMVRERFKVYKKAGISSLAFRFADNDAKTNIAQLEQAMDLVKGL